MSNDEVVVDEVTEVVKQELDAFVPDSEFELSSGEKIHLPKVTWKKEKVIYKKVGNLFSSVEELKNLNLERIRANEIVRLVSILLVEAPDVISEIASVITDLEVEEVEDKLDSSDLIKLLVPFFSERIQESTNLVNEILMQ